MFVDGIKIKTVRNYWKFTVRHNRNRIQGVLDIIVLHNFAVFVFFKIYWAFRSNSTCQMRRAKNLLLHHSHFFEPAVYQHLKFVNCDLGDVKLVSHCVDCAEDILIGR